MKFDEKESKKVFYHPFFVSMATAAILNKSTFKGTTSHGI
jgi:hypothetical protein